MCDVSVFNQFHHRVIENADDVRACVVPVCPPPFLGPQACLQLIESSRMGLLSLMDEECRLGSSGSDEGVARKMHREHGKHRNYDKCGPATPWRGSDIEFVVHHYAGAIRYERGLGCYPCPIRSHSRRHLHCCVRCV